MFWRKKSLVETVKRVPLLRLAGIYVDGDCRDRLLFREILKEYSNRFVVSKRVARREVKTIVSQILVERKKS